MLKNDTYVSFLITKIYFISCRKSLALTNESSLIPRLHNNCLKILWPYKYLYFLNKYFRFDCSLSTLVKNIKDTLGEIFYYRVNYIELSILQYLKSEDVFQIIQHVSSKFWNVYTNYSKGTSERYYYAHLAII